MELILPLIAILAGVLLLLRIRDLSMSVNLGFLFLSVLVYPDRTDPACWVWPFRSCTLLWRSWGWRPVY